MPASPPVASAAEQVVDRDREVVVGVQQPGARRDDPVAVGVRVAGDGDVEAVAQLDQPAHHVRRGAVHADLAVVVERDEAERRVDLVVDDLEVEPVDVDDRLEVGDARAAQRVGADPHARLPDRVDVDHVREILDVRIHVVVWDGTCIGGLDAAAMIAVGLVLDALGDVRPGRPPARRVVLVAAVLGRVVARREHDPVASGVGEDRVAERRGRRVAVGGVDADLDPVGAEDADRGVERRLRQRVRVTRDEQRARLIPSAFRCRAIASLMARTWASVNVPLREVPRWPEVPNDDGALGFAAVRGVQFVEVDEHRCVWTGAGGGTHTREPSHFSLAEASATHRVPGDAAAHQPRRAVPRARELAPDRPCRQPRDARRIDGAGRRVRLRARSCG